jgi:RNase P subunit RPR2
MEASFRQMLCPNPDCETRLYIATVTTERMAAERGHQYVPPCPECATDGMIPLTGRPLGRRSSWARSST